MGGARRQGILLAVHERSSSTFAQPLYLTHRMHILHGAWPQVFMFIVHERSCSAFATAGLAGALSQPHLQTLNDLSRRPKVHPVKPSF